MHIKQATLAVAICTFFAQTLVSSSPVIKQRTCGTAPPSDELRAAHRYLSTTERQAGDIAERSTPHIVIDTYFHIVSSTANQNQVTDSMIRGQVSQLPLTHPSMKIWTLAPSLSTIASTNNDSTPTSRNNTPTPPSPTASKASTAPSTTPGPKTATTSA